MIPTNRGQEPPSASAGEPSPARIGLDPAVLAGKPAIRGTRVAVEQILEHLAHGWTEAEILQNYRITRPDIQACLAYGPERARTERAE